MVINTYKVPSDCFCSWLMPALSLHSVLCHIPQNKPSSPYIWKWMEVKLIWRMERGLYHTLHRTPVSLPQTSLVPLSSLPAIYSFSPGAMSPRLLSPSPRPPPSAKFYLPSVSVLHPAEWKSLGSQIGTAMSLKHAPEACPRGFQLILAHPNLTFMLLLMLLVSFPWSSRKLARVTLFSLCCSEECNHGSPPPKSWMPKSTIRWRTQSQSPWIWHPCPAVAEALPAQGAQPTVPK